MSQINTNVSTVTQQSFSQDFSSCMKEHDYKKVAFFSGVGGLVVGATLGTTVGMPVAGAVIYALGSTASGAVGTSLYCAYSSMSAVANQVRR